MYYKQHIRSRVLSRLDILCLWPVRSMVKWSASMVKGSNPSRTLGINECMRYDCLVGLSERPTLTGCTPL